MNINGILQNIAFNLKIDKQILLNAVKDKITDEELNNTITDSDRLARINELFAVDSKIYDFETKHISQSKEQTQQNFNQLKQNLAKLQILVLVKKLNESKGCDDVINALLSVLNNNFENVNNILTSNLEQTDGLKVDRSKINNNNKYNLEQTDRLKVDRSKINNNNRSNLEQTDGLKVDISQVDRSKVDNILKVNNNNNRFNFAQTHGLKVNNLDQAAGSKVNNLDQAAGFNQKSAYNDKYYKKYIKYKIKYLILSL